MHEKSLLTASFPTIVFTPARFTPSGPAGADGASVGTLSGQITIRGQTRPMTIAATLTRLRIVDGRGRMLWKFKGPPGEAPRGSVPWFAAPGRASTDHVVVCGHWAALGLLIEDDVVACDSGCVWGAELTAVRLAGKKKERVVVQEGYADGKD